MIKELRGALRPTKTNGTTYFQWGELGDGEKMVLLEKRDLGWVMTTVDGLSSTVGFVNLEELSTVLKDIGIGFKRLVFGGKGRSPRAASRRP